MLNGIFLGLIVGAVVIASFTGNVKETGDAALAAARSSVDIAIGLIGQMALWLGFMKVVQEAGLMRWIAARLRPVMTRLFPDVPADHPAMGAMIMNLAANVAGLANAATPFGLKAMKELDRLNRRPGVATDAMALFLAINTAGVAVLPLTVIGIRASLGSHDAAGIIAPSLLASLVTTIVGVIVCKLLQRLPRFVVGRFEGDGPRSTQDVTHASAVEEEQTASEATISRGRLLLVLGAGVALLLGLATQLSGRRVSGFVWTPVPHPVIETASTVSGAVDALRLLSSWLLPLLMCAMVLYGFGRRVKVYEAFIAGAKEGFQIAVSIIPFLVAILVAFGMFRASGGLEALTAMLRPFTAPLGIPPEVLPMALIRPFSGTGAVGVMTDTMKAHGPDSLIGYMVSVMNGSTETTFYVLAVYFGSVQIRTVRHTLLACLTADAVGLFSATQLARLFFHPL